jgi:hypothetical protein
MVRQVQTTSSEPIPTMPSTGSTRADSILVRKGLAAAGRISGDPQCGPFGARSGANPANSGRGILLTLDPEFEKVTAAMRKLLSISSCLVLIAASFLGYFTHEHYFCASQTKRPIVQDFDGHDLMPDLGGRTSKGLSEPPAHYLDICWLRSNAPAVLPAFNSEKLILVTPPSSYVGKRESFVSPGYRGPPFADHRIPRSPPSHLCL